MPSAIIKPATLEVFNSIGQLIQIIPVANSVFQKLAVDLSGQPERIYLVELKMNDKVFSGRLLFEK